MGPPRDIGIAEAFDIIVSVHDVLRYDLGSRSTREGRIAFWSTAVELGGRRGGASGAIFNTGGNAGGILAPILTPRVGERFGWPYAVALGSLACVLGLVLWLGIRTGEREQVDLA